MKKIKSFYERCSSIPSQLDLDNILISQGMLHSKINKNKNKIAKLSDIEWKSFSQFGEDGIIDWLLDRIAGVPEIFIEFGVGNYLESNTRMLLHHRNWSGLVFDGDLKNIDEIKNHDIYWRYNLTAKYEFVNKENINDLINENGFSNDIGLLSIDVDGNDYWIMDAIDVVKPIIIVCEYNAIFGNKHKLTIPYRKDFQRTKAHYSNLYFGASLPALIDLAEHKGYKFIGTNLNGVNAFFIRNDKADKALESITKIIAYPSKLREARNQNGDLCFTKQILRSKIINHMPLLNLSDDSITNLSKCEPLYSDPWQAD